MWKLGCEFVVRVKGLVREWINKNFNCVIGDIEIEVKELDILNVFKVFFFIIEEDMDGGDDFCMKYWYFDLRRGFV